MLKFSLFTLLVAYAAYFTLSGLSNVVSAQEEGEAANPFGPAITGFTTVFDALYSFFVDNIGAVLQMVGGVFEIVFSPIIKIFEMIAAAKGGGDAAATEPPAR